MKLNLQPKGGLSKHLFGEPRAAGLRDPLPGMDPSVDPDGGAVRSTGAELQEGSSVSIQHLMNKWLHIVKKALD